MLLCSSTGFSCVREAIIKLDSGCTGQIIQQKTQQQVKSIN
jgi:hypothetical protein